MAYVDTQVVADKFDVHIFSGSIPGTWALSTMDPASRASINFITAHDGFTLRDLVSYNNKHNLANGEHNNDGESHNRSWNCGIEGRTQDENVLELRASQQRNFLATLMISQGVPMLLHRDELGRTQEGNNNAYCQDSDLSWVHWEGMDAPLSEFFAAASKLRRDHPTFRRRRFFEGRPVERGEGQPLPDVVWLNPNGTPMLPRNWDEELARAIGVFYNGACIGKDARNRTINDLNFLMCFNSNDHPVAFTLPPQEYSHKWEAVLDTAARPTTSRILDAGDRLDIQGKSLLVLRAYTAPPEEPDHSVAASLALLRAEPGLPPTNSRPGREDQVPAAH